MTGLLITLVVLQALMLLFTMAMYGSLNRTLQSRQPWPDRENLGGDRR